MRIIFVPQYPTPLRYQEFWFWKLPLEFMTAGYEVVTLGEKYANTIKDRRYNIGMFSPINAAIELETEQIREYMSLDIKKDDILFLADISFPGIFATTLFHHKRPERMYAFCHATSINKLDYFEKYKREKFMIETAFANSFNKVFVGSKYHQQKLGWNNTVVTYLPYPPLKPFYSLKSHDIMSASRPTPQKVDLELETKIEKIFGEVYRPISKTWNEYYKNLAESKILLITACEDTFGYQLIDAVINNCIPLARNSLAYPEILPADYLYNDEQELMVKIDYILNSDYKVPVPEILCKNDMENFYKRIVKEMEN